MSELEFDHPQTTKAEQAYIQQFASKISVLNTKEILQYGSVPQQKSISFINYKLPTVPDHTNAEICTDINKLIKELETVDKACNDRDWNEKYNHLLSKASSAMTETARRFEIHITSLLYHIQTLDELYDQNHVILHEFDLYIAAGNLCLNRTLTEEIPALKQKAEQSNLQEDLLLLKDYEDGYTLLNKKIESLKISQAIPVQNAIHIRTVQQTEQLMIESLRTLNTSAFPLWKSSIVFSKGIPGNMEYPDPEKIHESTNTLKNSLKSVLNIYQNNTKN